MDPRGLARQWGGQGAGATWGSNEAQTLPCWAHVPQISSSASPTDSLFCTKGNLKALLEPLNFYLHKHFF